MENLIPLFGIVFAIGLPLSIPIVFLVLNYRRRKRLMELYHAERMAAIERGMELPPLPADVLDSDRRRRSTSLLPGLVWLFVGIAVVIGSQDFWNDGGMMLGLVPAGIGHAYLIYYFVEGRKIEARVLEHELSEKAVRRQIEAARTL